MTFPPLYEVALAASSSRGQDFTTVWPSVFGSFGAWVVFWAGVAVGPSVGR